MPATPAWIAAVEGLFNRGIRDSMQAAETAHRLEGTALRVDVVGLTSIRAAVRGGRLALAALRTAPEPDDGAPVNATIAGAR
jgi:ubiquinone biosynthesis protein UbiJ